MNNNSQLPGYIKDLISSRLKQDILEQVSDAVKAVSEIDHVDSREAYLNIQNRLQNNRQQKVLFNILLRSAAVLIIPLLIASGFLLFRQRSLPQEQQFAMQEITTPMGVRSHVILPDGSDVTLNAESTIKFRLPFDYRKREVSLKGEAFFEVRKNPKIPFVVKSSDAIVTVLGTRFNCKAYEGESNISVVLVEGKVSMNTIGGQPGEVLILKPGDRAVVDKTTHKTILTNGNTDKYIDWHIGKLVFDETPMSEVAIQLGRWFGVEIEVDDPQIKNYKLTTTFENESLQEILELIKLSSPIKIEYVSAGINKSNNTQTKSKVIFCK